MTGNTTFNGLDTKAGKRLIPLWILLILQIALAVFLFWPRSGGAVAEGPLLSFAPAEVTQIVLRQGGDASQPLKLVRAGGEWTLTGELGFPADSGKIDRLLQSLNELDNQLPTAVTGDAAERFHVAADKFEKEVVLKGDSTVLAHLYVGQSAGAGRVYMRRAGASAIQPHAFSAWLLSTSPDDWRDKELLFVEAPPTQLTLPEFTLTRRGGIWRKAGSKEPLDQKAAEALAQRLTMLNYLDVLGRKGNRAASADYKVTLQTSRETLTYAFYKRGKPEEEGDPTWQLTRSDLPFIFKVPARLVTHLKEASLNDLRQEEGGKPKKSDT